MKKHFKKAKAEVNTDNYILCVLIALVILSYAAYFFKNEDYTREYYRAYTTLLKASLNSTKEWQGENASLCDCNKKICWTRKCFSKIAEKNNLPGETAQKRNYPGFLYGKIDEGFFDGRGTDENFCKVFTSSLVLKKSYDNCKNFISTVNTSKTGINGATGGVLFSNAFCSQTSDEIADSKNTNDICFENYDLLPTFITDNGQIYYMSKIVYSNDLDEIFKINKDKPSNKNAYRLVAVDLNGKIGPNSQFMNNSQYPDIVLFAINSTGNIIPLGLPEFSNIYLKSRVKYPSKQDSFSEITTLWRAKIKAWGPKTDDKDDKTVIWNQGYSQEEPFSQSVRLYKNAINCMSKNCTEDSKDDANKQYSDTLYTNLILQFMFKQAGSNKFNIPALDKNSTVEFSPNDFNFGCTKADILSASKCKIEIIPR